MVTKYVSLPEFAADTGMYAFLYSSAGVLRNSGGDALALISGSGGTFTFDVAESLTDDYVEVRIHGSSSPSAANLKFQGSLARGTHVVRDTYPPAAMPSEAGYGYSSGLLVTTGTITGFPDSLVVGDNYSEETGNLIRIWVRDSQGNPITGLGDLTFEDAGFEISLTILQGPTSIVKGVCEWVPPDDPDEGYIQVELPGKATRRASPGSARMQLVLRWPGGIEISPATQDITWVAKNIRL